MSDLIGYARVSSADQDLNLQIDALIQAGCKKEHIFTDKLSAIKDNRPGLDKALSFLRPGDTLVVWRLDRLGRSLKDLIEIVEQLGVKKVNFKTLTDGIDTTTSGGRLIFHIFGAIAEFERELIRERTNAGLAAARARGRLGGRKIKYDSSKIAAAEHLAKTTNKSIREICKIVGVSTSTYYSRRSKRDTGTIETGT